MDDFWRHGRFERTVTNEHHDAMYLIWFDIEKVHQRLGMYIVLDDRVLKRLLEPVNHLCPSRLIGLAEYPPLHVFGFDYENSVP